MKPNQKQILLTNDDGILSPGLWAAASALSELGYVWVVAPNRQYSSAGRSMPNESDGIIEERTVHVKGQDWKVYAVGGSPAQVVDYAMLEILPGKPDLVVSGINYGENVGTGVTVSGTIGAALEGATFGVPALAVSVQLRVIADFLLYGEIDFSASAFFTRQIARQMLRTSLPGDVDVLKVEVPIQATPQTPCVITRQSRHRYYESFVRRENGRHSPAKIGVEIAATLQNTEPDSDIHSLLRGDQVSITPLSLDLTSRCDLQDLERQLNG